MEVGAAATAAEAATGVEAAAVAGEVGWTAIGPSEDTDTLTRLTKRPQTRSTRQRSPSFSCCLKTSAKLFFRAFCSPTCPTSIRRSRPASIRCFPPRRSTCEASSPRDNHLAGRTSRPRASRALCTRRWALCTSPAFGESPRSSRLRTAAISSFTISSRIKYHDAFESASDFGGLPSIIESPLRKPRPLGRGGAMLSALCLDVLFDDL